MKKCTTMAVSAMILSSLSLNALAQGPDNGPGQPPVKHPQQHVHSPQHATPPAHSAKHQQKGSPHFRQGRPLPPQFRGEGYQVNDWHKRGLKAPPPGHRWMNVEGNYVLIAVATGVIASVIAHH